jgi:hypothetical protein
MGSATEQGHDLIIRVIVNLDTFVIDGETGKYLKVDRQA